MIDILCCPLAAGSALQAAGVESEAGSLSGSLMSLFLPLCLSWASGCAPRTVLCPPTIRAFTFEKRPTCGPEAGGCGGSQVAHSILTSLRAGRRPYPRFPAAETGSERLFLAVS